MAYLPNDPNQEQDNEDKAAAPEGGQQQVIGAPGATPIAGAGQGSGGQAQQQPNKPSQSGSFTNLMSYVNANKGNDAAMAGGVRSNTEARAQTATQAGNQFQNTANQQIESNTVRDSGLTQQLRTLPTRTAQAPAPVISQDQFNKQYNAAYSGPKTAADVQGYGETGQTFKQVAEYGKLAGGDMADRGALLTDAFGKDGKRYNTGERRLDSFILGAGDEGRQAMKDIANQYSDYEQNWKGLQDYLGGRISQAEADTAATRAATRAAADEARQGFGAAFSPLKEQADAATKKAEAEYAALLSGDRNTLARHGLDASSMDFLKSLGVDYGKLVESGPKAYSMGDLVDQGQKEQYQGLLGLLNGAGADAASDFDFTAAGGQGAKIKQDIVSQSEALDDRWNAAAEAADAVNAARQSEYAAFERDPGAWLKANRGKFGLDETQAAQLVNSGVDLNTLLSRRDGVNRADFVDPKEQEQFKNLFGMLGLNAFQLLRGSGNTGDSWKFDRAAADKELQRFGDYLKYQNEFNTQPNFTTDRAMTYDEYKKIYQK
jgi:hypothetical protein